MQTLKIKRPYINIRMILRVLGWLLFIEAAFMLIPLVTSLIYGEEDYKAFLWSIVITVTLGFGMKMLPVRTNEVRKRDAILLTSMVWIVFSLFGMLPFLFSGAHSRVCDGFFEAMSGFTTTGLSVFDSLDSLTHGILIWRSVMQWIGGLGIILFTLAVLPMLNYSGGLQLYNAEVSGIAHYKLRPRVNSTAKGMWFVYISLTLLCILLLLPSEMDPFEAVCYGMTTMSTGGFAVTDAGIGQWDSIYIMVVFIIFMFLGGINFGLLFNAAHGNFKLLHHNDALRWYCGIIVVCSVIMAVCIALTGNCHSVWDVTVLPLFQTISLSSSTGLVQPGFQHWGALCSFLFLFLIFIGACAGSTSGGAKVDRLIVVFKNIKNEFFRIVHPNAILSVYINGRGTPAWMVQKAMTFMLLYFLVITLAGVTLVCLGLPLGESLFSVLEAITNAGLGVTLEGEPATYGSYPAIGKYILALVMLIGRLELYTVLVLATAPFWRR